MTQPTPPGPDQLISLATEQGPAWVYRQPGGCIEIGQADADNAADQDLIHFCNLSEVVALIGALQKVAGPLPDVVWSHDLRALPGHAMTICGHMAGVNATLRCTLHPLHDGDHAYSSMLRRRL